MVARTSKPRQWFADRGPQTLRHRDRALSAGDLEWLRTARRPVRVLARAKCILNVNRDLRFGAGWVTVMIIPSGLDSVLTPGSELISEVTDYLAARAFFGVSAGVPARINVIGPGYIRVTLEAAIVPSDIEQAERVKRAVIDAIAEFFHPLTGGPDGSGWEFARDVFESEIDQVLEDVEGVSHVKSLNLVPAIAQHLLQFSNPVNTAADLPENSQVSTVDLRKAASLAEPLSAGPVNRAAREGLQGRRPGDVCAGRHGGFRLPADHYGGDAVSRWRNRIPEGKRCRPLRPQRPGRARRRNSARTIGILSWRSTTLCSPRGSKPVTSLTVFYPFTMTVRSAVSIGQRHASATIDAYTLDGELAAGAIVAALDNQKQAPARGKVCIRPDSLPITSLAVQGFTAKDSRSSLAAGQDVHERRRSGWICFAHRLGGVSR